MSLGRPYAGEQPFFQSETIGEITIWFANNIKPEISDQPVRIDVRKVFLGYELLISGAKQDLVIS